MKIIESTQKPLPPHTLREPSEEHPRSIKEIWYEFLDWKQATFNVLRELEEQGILDKSEIDRAIDQEFCSLASSQIDSILRTRLESGLSIPSEYEPYLQQPYGMIG